ncbi:MAG: hypothetical protein E7B11_23835 [Clostridiales bacterium]|nr:hypothetical protein [Clostridiales bacterium]MDU3243590.1 hypothetical protein [Clostridiales bacterium]
MSKNQLSKIRAKLSELDYKKNSIPFFKEVKNVIFIESSSRGGSSYFTEVLRQSPLFLHFRAEIAPFLKLSGLSYPDTERNSDVLTAEHTLGNWQCNLDILQDHLWWDLGNILGFQELKLSAEDYGYFVSSIMWRLIIQWPECDFDIEKVKDEIRKTFEAYCDQYDFSNSLSYNLQMFYLILLKKIQSTYKKINPYYYDIDKNLIGKYWPEAKKEYSPPAEYLLEEPPFILIYPWKHAQVKDLETKPIVIKTPSNAYRFDFFKNLFINAQIRYIYLTRNPAASINGLMDGWQYHGFFSHKVNKKMAIRGYTDKFPDFGEYWWKFDLPDGWENRIHEPLEVVCGFQWYSAHKSILDYFDHNQVDYLQIAFEKIIQPSDHRNNICFKLANWLNIDPALFIKFINFNLPFVMATTMPQHFRWKARIELLRPIIQEKYITDISIRMGYEKNYQEWS